jgi:peptide deformylase
MSKTGRNEPCPCKSGKKYKKCCGKPTNLLPFPAGQVCEIRTGDDPVLKTICSEVANGENMAFIGDMIATLDATKNGVGLAAPQIGVAKRVIVVRQTAMINPVVTWASVRLETAKEACLSYPGRAVDVTRHHSIQVKYFDRDGTAREEKLSGFEARIAQHELDHLDGVCKVGEAIPTSQA